MTTLSANIACRVDASFKRKIDKHVRTRRRRGEGISPADVIREALVEYFYRRDTGHNGMIVTGPHTGEARMERDL